MSMKRSPPYRATTTYLFLLAFLLLISPLCATLDRLRRYQRHCFLTAIPCVTFMNEGSTFGCSQCSEDTIQKGVVEFSSQVDFIRFIRLEEAERSVIMIPEFLLFRDNVMAAMSSDPRNIAAIIVYEGESPASVTPIPFPPFNNPQWSVDNKEPNIGYNYPPSNNTEEVQDDSSPNNQRNMYGTNVKFAQYRFNIFRVNRTVAEDIRNRSTRFVQPDQTPGPTSPRYKVQSNGQMFACPNETALESGPKQENEEQNFTVTSGTCLIDQTCLPIGGHSVWSALGGIQSSALASDRKFLAISSPMDSMAFFNDLALGAGAEMASLAAMLAVAQAVSNYSRTIGESREVLRQPVYFAWSAQSWGYTGSSRFMEDVHTFNCNDPIDTGSLEPRCDDPFMPSLRFLNFKGSDMTFLNIGPLTDPQSSNDTETYTFYTQGLRSLPEGEETEIEAALKRSFEKVENADLEDGTLTLTPLDASQSYRQYRPNADTITVGNYKLNFTNSYYHSQYDDPVLIDLSPVYLAADAIALTVIDLVYGDEVEVDTTQVRVNRTIIDQVMNCMTSNWTDCLLAEEYLGDETFQRNQGNIIRGNSVGSYYPFPRFNDSNPSAFAKLDLIRSFLAYQNRFGDGEGQCSSDDECKTISNGLNEGKNITNSSQLQVASCTRGMCFPSETFTHNAFGTGLKARNKFQSLFELQPRNDTEEAPGRQNPNVSRPAQAAWAESVWDPELGICGFTEDTSLFGGLILGAGIGIFVLSLILTYVLERILYPKKKSRTPEIEPEASPHQSQSPV